MPGARKLWRGRHIWLNANSLRDSYAFYSFCVQTDCIDGAEASGGLVQGTDGNFYGTAQDGGAYYGDGTVFKIAPADTLARSEHLLARRR